MGETTTTAFFFVLPVFLIMAFAGARMIKKSKDRGPGTPSWQSWVMAITGRLALLVSGMGVLAFAYGVFQQYL